MGEIGEEHSTETHAIPLCIQAALGMRPCFQIFGTDYATKDGSAERDYVHVCDIADAHVRALEYLSAGGENAALNLGPGCGVSVLELIDAVQKYSGRTVPVHRAERREGDPPL